MNGSQPVERTRRITWGAARKFIRDYWRDYVVLFIIGGVIVALDQWTKALVRADIPLGGDWLPAPLAWLMPFARIRHWNNSGAAFGFFQSGNLLFTLLAIVVSGVIIYYYPRVSRKDLWLRVAMGMQFGGALGNLVDRVAFARVTDFISVGNFAVFNVADSSISVGVALLLLGAWLSDRAAKKKAVAVKASGESPQPEPAAGEGSTKSE